jgi:hypothetical protein
MRSFSGDRVRILNFPFSRPQLLLNLGAAAAYERASSSVTFLSKEKICLLVLLMMLSNPLTLLLEQGGSLIPPHKTDAAFRSAPMKKHSWKLPNTRIFKPKQNILHDT